MDGSHYLGKLIVAVVYVYRRKRNFGGLMVVRRPGSGNVCPAFYGPQMISPRNEETSEPIEPASLLLLADMMLEWCHLRGRSINDLLVHRPEIVSRFEAGERRPAYLFENLL